MKLYHCPHSRSVRPLWLLEELEIPYQLEQIDIFKGEGQSASYKAINPHGSVPSLDDDGTVIYEAGAICMYLTDKCPEKNLAPELNTPERGLYYQWMFYVPATMEIPLVTIFLHSKLLDEEKRIPSLVDDSRERFKKIAKVLNKALSDRPYILGDRFSTADIMIASTLQWFPELMEGYTALEDYSQRLLERPAYQRAREL